MGKIILLKIILYQKEILDFLKIKMGILCEEKPIFLVNFRASHFSFPGFKNLSS